MAELADASVSNTDGATHPGSSPGPGTSTTTVDLMVFSRCFFIASRLGYAFPKSIGDASPDQTPPLRSEAELGGANGYQSNV